MSEVEISQVNPIQEDQNPIHAVDVDHTPQADPTNPLKDWVEKQSNPVPEDIKVEAEPVVEEEPKEDPLMSQRFAELSKREYAAVAREKELKAQEEKFKYIAENMDELKGSPKKVLEELGLDFEKFTSAYLDELDGKEKAQSPEEMIAAIEAKSNAKWQEFEAKQAEMDAAREEQVKAQYKQNLKAELSSELNQDRFELINLKGAHDVVYGVIEQHYNETEEKTGEGQMLSIQEAAQIVEDHLEKEARTLLKAKKLAMQEAVAEEAKQKSVTLSNRSAGGAVVTDTAKDLSKLSATEVSKKNAASLLKWD